jgi:hypothetical protein
MKQIVKSIAAYVPLIVVYAICLTISLGSYLLGHHEFVSGSKGYGDLTYMFATVILVGTTMLFVRAAFGISRRAHRRNRRQRRHLQSN